MGSHNDGYIESPPQQERDQPEHKYVAESLVAGGPLGGPALYATPASPGCPGADYREAGPALFEEPSYVLEADTAGSLRIQSVRRENPAFTTNGAALGEV